MLLRRSNLNDLPVLRELLRSRSVSRTAATVGLTQSAVSSTLARLRHQFSDELLLQQGRRMVLTAKAEALIEQVERTCAELELLLGDLDFVPERQDRRFVVAAADYVTFLLAPILAALISHEAPDVSVQFIDYPGDTESSLAVGEIDLAILPFATAGTLLQRFEHRILFTDETVVISSKKHKPIVGALTRSDYEARSHVTYHLPPPQRMSYEDLLVKRGGVRQKTRILAENFLVLPVVVEASDCLALVQRRLAEAFSRIYQIELHKPPFPAAPLEIAMLWSRNAQRDPAQVWFRDCMIRAASQIRALSALGDEDRE